MNDEPVCVYISLPHQSGLAVSVTTKDRSSLCGQFDMKNWNVGSDTGGLLGNLDTELWLILYLGRPTRGYVFM